MVLPVPRLFEAAGFGFVLSHERGSVTHEVQNPQAGADQQGGGSQRTQHPCVGPLLLLFPRGHPGTRRTGEVAAGVLEAPGLPDQHHPVSRHSRAGRTLKAGNTGGCVREERPRGGGAERFMRESSSCRRAQPSEPGQWTRA